MSLPGDPTLIGRVRHVLAARVTVELTAETAPIYRGRLYPLGQVGSIVRMPHGATQLIGAVTMVGVAEIAGPQQPSYLPTLGDRWIQLVLLGQIDGLGRFQRGVAAYPSLDDPVHITTLEDLSQIYPPPGNGWLRIGSHTAAGGLAATINLEKLLTRHSVLVGSTGAGKSSTVASLLQAVQAGGYQRAHIVVIDPHDEYRSAFAEASASTRSVLGEGSGALEVPYWALKFNDLLQAIGLGSVTGNTSARLHEIVVRLRKQFVLDSGWESLSTEEVSVDSPIPFDIRHVWYELDYENRATYNDKSDPETVQLLSDGSAEDLIPASFTGYGPAGATPHKGNEYDDHGSWPARLKQRLTDPRFRFLWRTWPDSQADDQLPELIAQWLGGEESVSILDFNGVPGEAADLAIGLILRTLFEAAVAGGDEGPVGRTRPVLVILEEAHRYIGKSGSPSTALARSAAERIAREGRKYGIGLMSVTQRPSELSPTVLSQAGTLISLRLTNQIDQGVVKNALPDAVANLAEVLPSLRTGEALISGEAVAIPARVVIDRPHPQPAAIDPSIESWQGDREPPDLTKVVELLRGQILAQ